MNNREPGHLRRRIDRDRLVGLAIATGTIIGMVWSVWAYPIQWQKASLVVDQIEPIVYKNQTDIRINDAVQSARYEEVIRRLSRIENKIDHQVP